jgi:hypothetical protein
MLLAESLLKLQCVRLPHPFGTAQKGGSTPMRTALGCHQSKGFEQRLQARSVVEGMLARGTVEGLSLRALLLALQPMRLRRGHEQIPARPQLAALLTDRQTLVAELNGPLWLTKDRQRTAVATSSIGRDSTSWAKDTADSATSSASATLP